MNVSTLEAPRSKAEVRVEIAEEVISAVIEGSFIAQTGIYSLSITPKRCKVCAIGAMSIIKSVLDKDDNPLLGHHGRHFEILTRVFSEEQLRLIETAFEICFIYSPETDEEEESMNHGVQFGRQYYRDGDRLEMIMHNICDNKGEFKP